MLTKFAIAQKNTLFAEVFILFILKKFYSFLNECE